MSGQAREAAALRLDKVARSYRQGGARLEVFRDASLAVRPGEIVGLVGPSGSGKSTLLHIAGLLDTPDTGEVAIAGRSMAGASDAARTAARRRDIGFVYQFHHLLPEFTARENVAIAQLVAGAAAPRARARAEELLTALGLGQRLGHRPGELSGGEQQRVAIARAIANRPLLLLGDEPTGNLDPPTADRVFAALLDLARAEGLAALIATHNLDLAGRMDRVLRLEDGHIVEGGAR